MSCLSIFDRLLETVELISHHPDFPGKGEAVDRCRAEIEDMLDGGRITIAQRDRLQGVLRGASPRAVCDAAWVA
jgi:hypothetical protein